MRTGIRMSLLNPDAEGWVTELELRAYLEFTGLVKDSKVEDLLIITGERAPEKKKEGCVNLTMFAGTFLDHGSSSGILNNPEGFIESRLELLKRFANDEGRMYKKDIAIALNNFNQCPYSRKSFLGTNIESFEAAGLIEIFGRTDESNGKKYFTLEDIDNLWKHNRFPEGWQPPSKSFYGTWPALTEYLKLLFTRVLRGWWNTQPPRG